MPDNNGRDLLIRNGQAVERGNMQTIAYDDPPPNKAKSLKGSRPSHDLIGGDFKLPNLYGRDNEMTAKEKQDVSSATSKWACLDFIFITDLVLFI